MTEHFTADEYLSYVEKEPRKKNQHHEYNLQVACWNHWKIIRLPGWFATARDLATKSGGEGERKKSMGCISGLWDMEFWLPAPRRRLHAEAKDAKNRDEAFKKLTASQIAIKRIMDAYGEDYDIFWSVQSFVDMLTRHNIPWVQPRHAMTAEQRDIQLTARRQPRTKKASGKKRKEGPSATHKRFQRATYGL